MDRGVLSLHMGLCGALEGQRYLPCTDRNDPAITDEPEVIMSDAASAVTPVQSGSRPSTTLFDPNMKERKDEIDALRARVDVILNKMVQNSGDDVTRLRQKIAEMRTAPAEAPSDLETPKPAQIATKAWDAADPKNCPLSPMTANTTVTNATHTSTNTGATNNSATPSADTELHANLSIKSVAKPAEGSLLTATIADDERDDDEDDIDDMEFDFKLAALSLSKSVQMAENGPIPDPPRSKKESKDPPASLKASESMMLPDPGGDASYCSENSRCESPPPGSVLYEAAARKAESVVGREREQQEQLERDQLEQQLVMTRQLLDQQQEQLQEQNKTKRHQPSPEYAFDNQSRASKNTHKSVRTCPNPTRGSPRLSSYTAAGAASSVSRKSALLVQQSTPAKQPPTMLETLVQPRSTPPAQTRSVPVVETVTTQPEPVEIIDADADEAEVAKPVTVVSTPTTAAVASESKAVPEVVSESKTVPEVVSKAVPAVIGAGAVMVNAAKITTEPVVRAPVVTSTDPPATPVGQRKAIEVPQEIERSKSPPPPVANVNIPNMVKRSNPSSAASVASHSDSSLTRPPSPTPVGEITMVEEVSEQRIRDPYGDKGLYSGVLVKRRPHGRGTMKYDDGRHYEGHWNHGRWHGVGRAIFANNDIFEGSYDMDQRHGHGMYQWNDGRVYTGQFFQDQRQGRGTYTWPDGAVYQGEFKAGHRHGQGMYRFADGSVYTGEWESGKYHGVGECRWSDGRSYRGEWKEGRANGYGVETRPNGTIRHDGEWKDDRPIRDSKRNTQGEGKN